jgi:predicted O-methyltransferase YrrM
MVHIPTLARIVGKSIRYPNRALGCALEMMRLGRLDPAQERQRLFTFLHHVFGVDCAKNQKELERSPFASWIRSRRTDLAKFSGPYRFGSSNDADCESLYHLVRALRPRLVVETGVCYGASSAYILEALEANGKGRLYSIDLGNTNDEPPNDFFVPSRLRSRWNLCLGDAKKLLPPLLTQLGEIDLFHHDSLHTYEHMMWEYETALGGLAPGGVISSHDVNAVLTLRHPYSRNPFSVFCEQHRLSAETAMNYGLAVDVEGRRARMRKPVSQSVAESRTTSRQMKRA